MQSTERRHKFTGNNRSSKLRTNECDFPGHKSEPCVMGLVAYHMALCNFHFSFIWSSKKIVSSYFFFFLQNNISINVMPESTEIPFYMRCFVTCQIVLVVHHPKKKKKKRRGRKKKHRRSLVIVCTFTSRDECAHFHGPTWYKVFVHVFYISLRIRIMSVNKLDIEEGSQVR